MRVREFFEFIVQRENIRILKEKGQPKPWTNDVIFQNYKFTNVKREHDKTTKKLCELFYQNEKYKDFPVEAHLLNAAIFRYFGTWEFAEDLGYSKYFDGALIKATAADLMGRGHRVFTGAYVISSFGIKGKKYDVLVDNVLSPLNEKSSEICKIIKDTNSWQAAITAMTPIKGFAGTGFMAKEVILDTIFTPLWAQGEPNDFNTWCPVGPGAMRGLNRVFGRDLNKRNSDDRNLKELISIFEAIQDFWPKNYVKLVLHDIQFQLCEFDKYERVRLNEGKPRSRYNGI